ALVNLTGDSGVNAWFDQRSVIVDQRYFVRFTGAQGVITGSEGTVSGTVTIETENPGYGSVNEVQKLSIDAGSATGTFRISIPFNGRTWTTYALPIGASAGDVQSAVNSALQPIGGSVAVTKAVAGTEVTYNLTYSGSLAAKNLDNARISVITDAPSPGGSFTLTYGGQTTAAIPLSSSTATQASEIQTALRALSSVGSGNVDVSYDNTSASIAPRFLVTFVGALGNSEVGLISASGSALQHASVTPRLVTAGRTPRGESQIVTLTKPTADGAFTLSLTHNSNTYTTSAIAFDATTADVQSALAAAIAPITGATAAVTYFNGTEIHITFAGTLSGVDLANITGSVTGNVVPAGLSQTVEGFDRPEVPAVSETLVVDYAADPLTIPSGPGKTFTFTMNGQLGELTEASGHLSGTLASFANVSGDFYFRRTLKEGVARLVVGASGVTAF
ncbi:MAG: hypothetical protein ACKOEO_01700, partial [Planctomycetaceae bacterium]